MLKRLYSLVVVLVCLLLLASCAAPAPTPRPTPTSAPTPTPTPTPTPAPPPELPKVVSIGTLPVGVVYQVMGVGIAAVLSNHTEMSVVNKPMSGAREFLPLVNKGEIGLSVVSYNDSVWGFTGSPQISAEPLKNLRLVVFGNWLQGVIGLMVRQDSGILSIAELKGRRVSGDYPGNPLTQALITAWLVSVGLSWDDVNMVPAPGILDGVADLRERRVDATFGGVPFAAYTQELHAAVPIQILDFGDTPPINVDRIPQQLIDEIRREMFPVFEVDTFGPAPPVAPKKYTTLKHPNNILASADLSEQAVYLITKALFENYEELGPYHNWFKQWKPETMFDSTPDLPYHPGSVRFFKEIGVWTAETEQIQQALLQQAQ
ncbi:TAXI family TRAP transporter solute-binding subunit [Chloroflexota bacterium]